MLRSGPIRLVLVLIGSAIFAILVARDTLPLEWLVIGPLLVGLAEVVLSGLVGRQQPKP
jgi:hypothetical protein